MWVKKYIEMREMSLFSAIRGMSLFPLLFLFLFLFFWVIMVFQFSFLNYEKKKEGDQNSIVLVNKQQQLTEG